MRKNSFVEGTLVATLAIIFTKILGIIYVIPFYSTIGSAGSALYSYAYNIYLIFLSISSAGIPIAMSKIVSELQSKKMYEAKVRTFNLGIIIISILSALSFLVLIFFAEKIALLIVGNVTDGNTLADITMVIYVVSFSVLIIPFLSITKGYLQGHKFIEPSSNSQLIEQIVRIIVIVAGSYVAIKVLHLSNSIGVAVGVAGSFVGGLAAIAYLMHKVNKNKDQLSLNKELKKDNISNKEILKKILYYSLPFIIINLTVNLYNTVDMALIIRTLSKFGYTGADSEFIAGIVTTWGYKLNMIVNSVATGLTISLIPSIVSAYTLKKKKEVNNIFNKALQIVLFVSLPAAIGLSFLATPVWTTFYGINNYGPVVFRYSIMTAIMCNVYLVSIQTAQSVNKYKLVYCAVIGGALLNALLDVPFMHLFYILHLPAYYGATTATMTGYTFSILLVLLVLKKKEGIKYKETIKIFGKIFIGIVCMVIVLFGLKLLIPLNPVDRIKSILEITIFTIVGGITYFLITYKMGVITALFGQTIIDKALKIVTFGMYKKGDKNVSNKGN